MAKRKIVYGIHPSIAYCQSIIKNIPKNTGKTLAQWTTLLKKTGLKSEEDYRAFLKNEFKLGGTTTWIIADIAKGKTGAYCTPEAYLKAAPGYIEKMYKGKETLRPIHDALVNLALSLGKDVKICPCETIVPLYRQNVFAEIKPSTKTRIDFSLALKNSKKKPSKRLIDTGGMAKGDRLTHRFPITSVKEIDKEVKKWLKIAYELNPPKE